MNIKDKLTLCNCVTFSRILIIFFLIYFAYVKELLIFSILFYVAAASDYIDGPISRKQNNSSKFGSDLDYSADKIIAFLSFFFVYLFKPEIIMDNKIPYFILITIIILHEMAFKFKNKNKIMLHTNSARIFIGYYYASLPIIFLLDSYRPLFYLSIFLGSWSIAEMTILGYAKKELTLEVKSILKDKYDPFYYLTYAFPMKALLFPFMAYFVYLGEYGLFIFSFYIASFLDFIDGGLIHRIVRSNPIALRINEVLDNYFIIAFVSILLVFRAYLYEMDTLYLYGLIFIMAIFLIINLQKRYSIIEDNSTVNRLFLIVTYALLPLPIVMPYLKLVLLAIIALGLFSIAYHFTSYIFYGKSGSEYPSPLPEQLN